MISLTKKKPVRRHPNGSLKSSTIGPKSIMQSQRLVFPIGSNRFPKYRLDLTIRHLNLTTSLRMIMSSYFMSHRILSKQSLKKSMTEMTTNITNKSSRDTISIENTLFHKFNHNLVVIGPSNQSFHPFDT